MEPGTSLAHYRLVEKIGEGGMGQVYKARDTKLERDVAIKVLNTEFSAEPRRLVRFKREAKLLASINHPNIATIYGLEEQDGLHFIAMELIPGKDLEQRLDEGPLALVDAMRIARQIAAALEATHERGVIHRDLKPANVHLTPGGDVKVLDFGIARDGHTPEPEDDLPEPTRPGSILGTVSYMSPEQARGTTVDAATDLWAFGCVLYRMLAGRIAFAGDTRWDRLAAVLREEPDWDALPGDTPPPITDLVRRCLVKDRGRRFDDAGAARRLLESVLGLSTASGESLPTSGSAWIPPGSVSRGWRVARSTLVALVIALAAAGLWWVVRSVTGPEATGDGVAAEIADRSLAVLPFENLGGGPDNAPFTAGIHDDILNRVAKIRDLRVISRTSVMEYRSTTKSLREIGDELGVSTVLEGGVQRSGNQVRINLRLIDTRTDEPLWTDSFDRELSAEQLFAIQSDVAEQVAAALQATLSAEERRRIEQPPTTDLEAYDAYLQGLGYLARPGQLEENLLPARRMFHRAIDLDPQFALAYAGLSRAARDHYWLGGGTEEALDEALAAATRAVEIAPDLSEAHLALGTYLYIVRDYDAALEELRTAEQGLPGNSELIRWKAYIMRRRGHWDEALRDLKRARALDPRDVEATHEVGFTLMNLRRYDEAKTYFDEALRLAPDYPLAHIYGSLLVLQRDGTEAAARIAADGIEHTADVPWKYVHAWQAMISAGDYERAEEMAAAPGRAIGQWHDYPSSLLLGWTYALQGRREPAEREFRTAAAVLEGNLAARPEDPRLHVSLGIAYAGLGRFEEAIAAGRRAVELMPIEKDTFVGTWLLHDLGWIYVMAGDYDAAVEAFDQVLRIPSVWSIEMLMIDPRTRPLREHPGFRRLVAKYSIAATD